MKKMRFSVDQTVAVLKQAQVGVPVVEVIRKAGISEQMFYRWKAKYAGRAAASGDSMFANGIRSVAWVLPICLCIAFHAERSSDPYTAQTGVRKLTLRGAVARPVSGVDFLIEKHASTTVVEMQFPDTRVINPCSVKRRIEIYLR